jgi:hypothetical protein
MYQWLRDHPDVFMSELKEPGYFIDGYGLVTDGVEYEKLFVPAGGRVAGEATALYLANPETPGRIHAELGDVRILILLRDPVARAFSLYTMIHQLGYEPIGTFEAALAAEPERAAHPDFAAQYKQPIWAYLYFASGLYSRQVLAYQQQFSAVQVLLFEDLLSDPQGSFDATCDFLGVPRQSVNSTERANPSRRPRWPDLQLATRRAILSCEDSTSLPKRVGKTALWQVINLNIRLGRAVRIAPGTAAQLRDAYAEDVGRTAEVIGRDLSAWLPDAQRTAAATDAT